MSLIPLRVVKEDRILIIAPHPDDESIGCGGVILRYPSQCSVLVVTDGENGRTVGSMHNERLIRKRQFEHAMKLSGVSKYRFLGYPDGEMFGKDNCFESIEFKTYTKIFIPGINDNHSDHIAIAKYAIEEISRQIKQMDTDTIEVYQYEVHSTLAEPTHYLDITEVINKKINMINCHTDQVKAMPYAEMAEKLSEYRALSMGMINRNIEVYSYTSISNYENTISVERDIKIQKLKQINRILSRWIELNQDGNSISNALRNRSIKRVSIYGYSTVGNLLLKELNNNDIEVIDVFDRRKIKRGNMTTISPQDGMREVDAVIVTVAITDSEIINMLIDEGYKRVLTIQDLIER